MLNHFSTKQTNNSSIFFEWSEFEQKVKSELSFPDGCVFTSEVFSINKGIGFENVSIFVESRISNSELDELKKSGCKKILLRCAGSDMLNCEYAKSIGIKVFRVASYSPESIAEFVFALILNLARNLNHQRRLHTKLEEKRDLKSLGFSLKGKTLGIHGYGKIGRSVAHIARNGFQMKVLYFDPYYEGLTRDTRVADLSELYLRSDIVSIHVPLCSETKNLVGKKLLKNVKERFMLINTSRGGVLNSKEIKELLQSKIIDFLGVDVWRSYDDFDKDLLKENIIQTDHVAFLTEESIISILNQTLNSLAGNPSAQNII